jgi:hypothetical protein
VLIWVFQRSIARCLPWEEEEWNEKRPKNGWIRGSSSSSLHKGKIPEGGQKSSHHTALLKRESSNLIHYNAWAAIAPSLAFGESNYAPHDGALARLTIKYFLKWYVCAFLTWVYAVLDDLVVAHVALTAH